MPPLSFTDEMLDRLTAAAAMLPANTRNNFMRSVANRIADLRHPPGLPELEVAIAFVLNARGIGGGYQAFHHIKQDKVARHARAELSFNARSSL
jgi:hypothetical protein